jgi:hypothetical protein
MHIEPPGTPRVITVTKTIAARVEGFRMIQNQSRGPRIEARLKHLASKFRGIRLPDGDRRVSSLGDQPWSWRASKRLIHRTTCKSQL